MLKLVNLNLTTSQLFFCTVNLPLSIETHESSQFIVLPISLADFSRDVEAGETEPPAVN